MIRLIMIIIIIIIIIIIKIIIIIIIIIVVIVMNNYKRCIQSSMKHTGVWAGMISRPVNWEKQAYFMFI